MKEPMYAFQKDAVARIAKGEQVYLGFDPGLGKSRTALEGARHRAAKRILVICHASGRYVWEEQVRLWSHYHSTQVLGPKDLPGAGVKIVTYGLISKGQSAVVKAIATGDPYDMTILDESHAVKNPGSNRTKAILDRMLNAGKLGYVVPLSGTPAPNHAGELYPILKALYPKALVNGGGKEMYQWQFEDRYCKVALKKFGHAKPIRVIEGSRNMPELRSRIGGFMLRVRKEMVLRDLPPVRYDVVPIGVDPGAASRLPPLPSTVTTDEDILNYFRGGDEHVMRTRRVLGVLKTNPAIEYINDFMEGLPQGRKILVFAHHKEVIGYLMAGLANYHPVKIDGSSSTSERNVAVTTFLNDHRCRIFVGNIAAAGTGLTLVGPKCWCSDVIFVEASFSVGENVQAAARVHRIGQREAVVARFLTAHGTLDDAIQNILARKARDFHQLFN